MPARAPGLVFTIWNPSTTPYAISRTRDGACAGSPGPATRGPRLAPRRSPRPGDPRRRIAGPRRPKPRPTGRAAATSRRWEKTPARLTRPVAVDADPAPRPRPGFPGAPAREARLDRRPATLANG